MQPKLAPWNMNNNNVLILAGAHVEEYALKYGICICPNEINLIPCKYIAIYSGDTINYLFEIIKAPLDDVNIENTGEIRNIHEIEKTDAVEWQKGMGKCRMFTIKKLAAVGPVINDYISPTTRRAAPLTRGTPRYTTYDKIKTAKLTSELGCVFDDEEVIEKTQVQARKEQIPQEKPKKNKIPLYIGISGTVIVLAILVIIFWPETPQNEIIKIVEKEKKQTGPPKNFLLEGSGFDSGKSEIKEQTIPVLKNILSILNAYPDWDIKITGHTDNVGPEESNKKLSTERAKAVMDWFIKNGIDSSRLTYEGKGSAEPIADNSIIEGRRKNRRTEIKVVAN